MNRSLRIAILLFVALAVAGVLFWGRGGDSPLRAEAPEAAPAGAAAPPAAPAEQQPTPLPRLVDLGSTTCIPCKKMAPILAELAAEQTGRLEVLVIDVREDQAAAAKYGIRLIPTQIFFDATGKEVWRHEGFIDKAAILARWAELGVTLAAAEPPSQ